ncbi:MAG TPA: glycosyltransferase family A protein, partial [Aquella sp.]|nr:glycosyltransferase family A protein [Aquella sp.]
MTPLVSIIMPAFNAASTIKLSIESVLNQTYSNWELIIINDASKDNTASVVNDYYSAENRIVIINLEKNGGLPNARNEGLKCAKGEYIAFLDSDDTWHAQKLMKQVSFHLANPQIRISHTKFEIFNELGILKTPFKKIVEHNYKKEGFLLPSIYSKNTIGVLTVMVERELLLAVGGFDTSLWTMEDQDLWIKVAKLGECFGYINENLAKYRLSSNGMTNKIGKYKRAYK